MPAARWLAVLVILSGCARLEPTLQRVEWHGDVAAGESVEVVNTHGNISVRGASDGFVGLELAGQCAGAGPAIEASRVPDGIRLEIRGQGDCLRIDAALYVGRGTPVSLSTDTGRIVARRVGNPIDASTRSGDISLSSTGWSAARTGSGTIRLNPASSKWARPLTAESADGAIVIAVPDGPVRVEACGASVESELPTRPVASADSGVCREVVRGRGLYLIRARSRSGPVRIFRQ